MKNLVQGVEMTERSLRSGAGEASGAPGLAAKGREVRPQAASGHVRGADAPSWRPAPIAEVIQDGYVLADRLLRPALVGVAKAPQPTRPPAQPGSRVDSSA